MIISTLNRTPKARKMVFPKPLTILLLMFFALTTSCVNAQTATIVTDQPDYAPGATANITGYGFQAGETITLQVVHVGEFNSDASHLPWQVLADDSGSVSSTWIVDVDALGATLLLTADGQSSGSHAEFIFTDAGEISITSFGTALSENFNTLAFSGTSSTLPSGWFFSETGTNANATYTAGTGSGNGGDTYSFGASASSERAFGGLRSGSLIPIIGTGYKNNIAGNITSLLIAYTGEQWRLGALGRTDRLDFQYSTNATGINDAAATWIDVDALDFTAPVITGTVGALDGNATANKTVRSSTISVSIPNGGTIWFRWTDLDATGADDGLAIDDFSITATGTISQPNLSINDVTLTEGNSGTSSFNFTVSLSAPAPAGGVTFDISTADNTATTANSDYTAKSLTAQTIPAGNSTYTFSVLVNGDLTEELNETFFVDVTNVTGATVTDGQGTGTITNDDVAPSFTAKPAATITLNAGTSCNATTTYTFATAGSPAPVLSYEFSGATTGSGSGTGSGSTFNLGTTTVTVTANNGVLPNAVYSFNIVVKDVTAPTVLTQNVTVFLDASGSAGVTAAQIDAGSSDACGSVSLSASPLTFNCSNILPVAKDLFISEYVEGSSNIKYLEIYNGTGSTINLANYELRNYANGNTSPTFTNTLSGNLVSGSTVVYKNSLATGYDGPATALSSMVFNGDDAVVLFNTSTNQFADIIGKIGNDPGTAWTAPNNYSTVDATLRRKLTVSSGVTINPSGTGPSAFTTLATEWDLYNQDDVSGLGSHGNTVTLSVTDNSGNTATGKATVIVKDNLAPAVPTIPDATGECSVTVTAPTTTDNCSGTITGTTDASALTFNTQGTSTITWTFKDASGNTSTAVQTVIVDDITAPVPNVASLPTITGECSATVTDAPKATDNCAGEITGTTSDPTSYTEQGTYTITWTYDDGNGNPTTQTQAVIVKDVTAPVPDVASLPTVTGECGATVTDTPTATDNCVGQVTGTTSDPTSYSAQGTYTITWTYDDGNGNPTTQTQTVIVKDVTAPVQPALADVTGECSATPAVPTTTDNCAGTLTGTTSTVFPITAQGTTVVTWTFDDGNGNSITADQNVILKDETIPTIATASNVTVNNTAAKCEATVVLTAPATSDNCGVLSVVSSHPSTTYPVGTTSVTWTVTDVNGNVNSTSLNVVVTNTDPVINSVTGSADPVQLGTSASLVINFTDNNVTSATINWDDLSALVTVSNPSSSFTVSKTYTTPGVYTPTITLTDACGKTTSYIYKYVVIYDPNGGFVTGGGWINSPAGAYIADPSLTGKANFGFVAKYKKGSTKIVDGETEFQFQAGNLKFNSSAYTEMSLVIGGAKASYKGTGTINGSGSYKFMLTAIDGNLTSPKSADKIRMKITDAGGLTVYDNLVGGGDDNADPTTVLGGGSIVIHSNKATKPLPVTAAPIFASELTVKVMPNPTPNYFNVAITGKNNNPVTVRVMDIYGRLIQLDQKIAANATLRLGQKWAGGTYLVEVMQGEERKVVKVIKAN